VTRTLNTTLVALAWLALIGASPAVPATTFPAATQEHLQNGVTIVSAATGGILVGASITVPGGLAQQSAANSGVADVAARLVLSTPIGNGVSLSDSATNRGATLTFTLDPNDTRFYLEAQKAQFPAMLHDLVSAIAAPDLLNLSAARAAAISAATTENNGPAATAMSMVRQATYAGTGYAYPEAGRILSLQSLTAADVSAWVAGYGHGAGILIALDGAVDDPIVSASRTEMTKLGGGAVAGPQAPVSDGGVVQASTRGNEIVTHRDVAAPWVAVGYRVPDMYSSDFPAMLVVEALLGQGGDVHAFSYGSESSLPDEYVGAYYDYQAQPGLLAIFLNGSDANVDGSVRDLQSAIARLRGSPLPDVVVDHGRRLAVGSYFTGVQGLDDAAWLMGRAAATADGTAFENLLPVRIAQVTATDVQRVARRYLTGEVVGVVLPQTRPSQ
jgi:predicted Zn-dependent peptidase